MSFHPNDIARRTRLSSYGLVAGFFLLLSAFFNAQVLENTFYKKASEENRLRAIPLPAPRGIIYDRKGQIILGHDFTTTGVLGLSTDDGRMYAQGFPAWLTIPSHQWLSMARAWHFFFAWIFLVNGLCYVAYTIASRHLARDLWPTRSDVRGIGASIVDHLRLRHPAGEAAKRYNVLQKIAYLTVIFVLLPLIVLMGLGMSPRLDTLFGGWVGWFGGRQSVRSIHFIAAWLIVAFVLIHVFEVIVTGLWNNVRSMITGRYRVPEEARRA